MFYRWIIWKSLESELSMLQNYNLMVRLGLYAPLYWHEDSAVYTNIDA